MPPITYPHTYDTWYECSRAAHSESIKIMTKMGYKNINEYQVGTKYHCKAVATY